MRWLSKPIIAFSLCGMGERSSSLLKLKRHSLILRFNGTGGFAGRGKMSGRFSGLLSLPLALSIDQIESMQ